MSAAVVSFMRTYLEVGGITFFGWLFFSLCRSASEKWGTSASPSVMIRIAQALIVGALGLAFVIHFIPEPRLDVVRFEVFSGKGDATAPTKEDVLRTRVQVPSHRAEAIRAAPLEIFKQRVRDLLEATADHTSLALLVCFIVGWISMSLRFLRQMRSLRELLLRGVTIRRVGRTQVLVTDEVSIPFSTLLGGVAYVVLPLAIAGDSQSFKIAILHELQHHRCKDTTWARFFEFVIILYFWNPGIYLWKKEIIQLQELACDEALIGQRRVSQRDYGNCLLQVAEAALVRHDMRIGTVCMAVMSKKPKSHVSFLRRRIDMFPSHKGSKRRLAWGLVLGTASLVLTTVVAYGAERFFKPAEQLAPNPGVVRFDPAIQAIAETALAKYIAKFNARAGFVLVSEVNTGRLLASANITDDLTASPNWALSYEVEPASAMKVPLVATALDEGATLPDEVHDCGNGMATVGHGTYRDWKPFGQLTTSETIIQSSNICSIRIAQKLGSSGVARSMSDFGFGVGGTTAGFPQARSGEIPDPSLYASDDYVPVIAVGLNTIPHFHVTPLEMVHAIGAIANNGRLMKAISFDADESSVQVVRQVVSERTADEMKAILRRVVLEGTGRSAKSAIYTTAGKTSSAFAPSSKSHDETGGERAMAGFVGFAPVGDPKLAVYVGLYDPHDKNDPNAHGNRHAAPVFREVIEGALEHLNVRPDILNSKE